MAYDKHYDKDWNRTGATEHHGNWDDHFDTNWDKTGHTEHLGDRDTHFDAGWNKVGHTVHQGERSFHYDKDWNKTGYTDHRSGTHVHFDKDWNKTGFTKGDAGHRSMNINQSTSADDPSRATGSASTSASESSSDWSAPSHTWRERLSVAKWLLPIIALSAVIALIANWKKPPVATPALEPISKIIVLQGPNVKIKALDLGTIPPKWILDVTGPDEVRVQFLSQGNALNKGIYKVSDCYGYNLRGEVYVYGPAGERAAVTLYPPGSKGAAKAMAQTCGSQSKPRP